MQGRKKSSIRELPWALRMRLVWNSNQTARKFFPSRAAFKKEQTRHMLENPSMIHPLSKINTYWQRISSVCYFFMMFYVPLNIVKNDDCNAFQEYTMAFLSCFCFANIFLNFRTGYITYDNKICLDPKKVFWRHLTTYFFFDFPYGYFIPCSKNTENFYWEVAKDISNWMKLVRCKTLMHNLGNLAWKWEKKSSAYSVYKHLIIGIFLLHWLTCMQFWCVFLSEQTYFISDDIKKGNNWMSYYPNTTSEFEWHINSLFRTVSLFRFAGLGNKAPKTSWEVAYMVITLIISLIFRVHFVCTFLSVVRCRMSAKMKYFSMVKQVESYLRNKGVPRQLLNKVLKYYEVRFKYFNYNEEDIMTCMSGKLRQEIIIHSCHNLVKNMPFFTRMPDTLLSRIVTNLVSEIYLIDDVIIKHGKPGNCMYFILKGSVAVYSPSGKEICHLDDGTHFGEISLVVNDHLRTASVIAIETCEIFRLDRKDFERIICPHPQIYDDILTIAFERLVDAELIEDQHIISMVEKDKRISGQSDN